MEWISVESGKPKKRCLCWVKNQRGYMHGVVAQYYPDYDIFLLHECKYADYLTLDVTHYFVLPS